MIIGLTGNDGSGKETVAKILKEMNFYLIPLSESLREQLKKEKKKITKESLIETGNKLRATRGPEVLAKLAEKKVLDGENHVITSLRNPEEVKFLQQREDFILINVTASEKVRLERYMKRGRDSDPKTIKELRAIEALENTTKINGQQLNKVVKMAKITLVNDSTENKLKEKVEKFIKDWLYKLQDSRPDWDHYFMSIAVAVSKRNNCLSAPKGTIIVRDRQILSTGYNGSPKGIKHCNEGGCQRCTTRHLGKMKSGVYAEPCICAHSEENAIVQAACNGTSTKGAMMYTTFTPCVTCSKMIINSGIKEVIARVVYPDDLSIKMLKEAGVKLRVLKQ